MQLALHKDGKGQFAQLNGLNTNQVYEMVFTDSFGLAELETLKTIYNRPAIREELTCNQAKLALFLTSKNKGGIMLGSPEKAKR